MQRKTEPKFDYKLVKMLQKAEGIKKMEKINALVNVSQNSFTVHQELNSCNLALIATQNQSIIIK